VPGSKYPIHDGLRYREQRSASFNRAASACPDVCEAYAGHVAADSAGAAPHVPCPRATPTRPTLSTSPGGREGASGAAIFRGIESSRAFTLAIVCNQIFSMAAAETKSPSRSRCKRLFFKMLPDKAEIGDIADAFGRKLEEAARSKMTEEQWARERAGVIDDEPARFGDGREEKHLEAVKKLK
jgi:hypothetical protein